MSSCFVADKTSDKTTTTGRTRTNDNQDVSTHMASRGHTALSIDLLVSYNSIPRRSVGKKPATHPQKKKRKQGSCIRGYQTYILAYCWISYITAEVKSILHGMVIMTMLSNETEARRDSSNHVFRGLVYMVKRKLWIWQDTTRYSKDMTRYVLFNDGYDLRVSLASMKLLSDSKNIFKI